MCEEYGLASKKLPLLPGYNFKDQQQSNFHKSHAFDYKLGIPDVKIDLLGPGRRERDIDSIQFYELEGNILRPDPELIYGRPKTSIVRPFRPHYVTYDRTCLRFRGYFQQPAFNTADESFRIRVVDLYYFLDDDTVSVIEPKIPNSGLPQGRLVRRSRIPQGPLPDCDYLHWKDLNLGKKFLICGYLVTLVDCDNFTKEFLDSQGVELNPPQPIPSDDYFKNKIQQGSQRPTTAPPKYRREFEDVVLKFRAFWETDGDENLYGISYYPSDMTVQITEVHEKNDGKDGFPVFLRRTKLPKAWNKIPMAFPSVYEEEAAAVTEFYQPEDLVVGQKITVFGREMLIHMCDDETRDFYKKHFNINMPDNFPVKKLPPPPVKHELPPYTGFGSLEDSLQSCLSFTMKSPRKDIVRKIVNANKFLRYKAELCSTHPEDSTREFIVMYSLADGTISITEPPKRNTGHAGGRFLSNMRVPKPGTSPDYPEYYSPHDFYIGNVIVVNGFRFKIVGADLHVYNYMQENTEKFRSEVADSIKKYFEDSGLVPKTEQT